MSDMWDVVFAMRWAILVVVGVVIVALAYEHFVYNRQPRTYVAIAEVLSDDGEAPEWPEYIYMDFPDGSVRRCKTMVDPTFGFPVTPGFNSPEWEVVDDEGNPV